MTKKIKIIIFVAVFLCLGIFVFVFAGEKVYNNGAVTETHELQDDGSGNISDGGTIKAPTN